MGWGQHLVLKVCGSTLYFLFLLTVYLDQNETEVRGRGLPVACARVGEEPFIFLSNVSSVNNDKKYIGSRRCPFFFFFDIF